MGIHNHKTLFFTALAILAVDSTTTTRIAAPTCDTAEGTLKYEVGKSYFYSYESHFDGFNYDGRVYIEPNPMMKVHGNVTFTFFSKCDILLSVQDMVVTTYANAKGAPTGTVTLEKSHMKFNFNHGLVTIVEMDPSDSAWSQNIKRGILSMVQNSRLDSKINATREASVYGICETTYDAQSGKKRIHLTKCERGENSDLIAQGIPYHLPHVQNKQIFGFLRPAQTCTCTQTLDKGILSESSCAESSEHPYYVGMRGMRATLKYSHAAATMTNKADMAHLNLRSTILYNFTTSVPLEKESKVGDQIKGLLTGLKSDGSNKADIYIQLKKMIKKATHLDQFTSSDLLKNEMHRKTFYDAMAEVATDESIRVLAKATKAGTLDTVTQLTFFTRIAFATNPGPSSLKAMVPLVKNVPKSLEKSNKTAEELLALPPVSQISAAQHLLLGASGLAYQFCKDRQYNCADSSEYVDLVNEIAELVNIKPILNSKTLAEGTEELQLAVLHALGNLVHLTPKAVKAVDGILAADPKKAPEWLTIQALDAFRRYPCEANLKKTARTIMGDSARSEQIRIAAYLATTKCFVASDYTVIDEVLKVPSGVSKFIATHVTSMSTTMSPAKLRAKSHYASIKIPKNLKVERFSRASQHVEYSAYDEKDNVGVTGEATMFFDPKQPRPDFMSLDLTFHLYGKSFNLIEIGLSRRFQYKAKIDEKYLTTEPDWSGFDQAATAKDSYVRVFGTTVGLGLETLHNDIQTTMGKMMTGETPTWNLKAIHPSTFLEEELSFPSLMGLPLTYDLDAVKFDTVKLAFTPGKKELMEVLFTLFQAPYDYKVTMTGDVAISGQAGLSLGANTPIAVGLRTKGKLDHKQTFGLEVASNDKALLDAKILFPETVIDSKTFQGERYSYQDVNGVVKKLRELDPSQTKTGLVPRNDTKCRECMLTGFKSCKTWSVAMDEFRVTTTFEKSDPKMTALDLTVKPDGKNGYGLTLTTPGATLKREFKLKYTADNSKKSSETVVVDIDAAVGAVIKQKGKITWTTTFRKQPAVGYWLPHDYAVTMEVGQDSTSLTRLVKATASSAAPTKVHLDVDISGILSANGNWTLEEKHTQADLDIKMIPSGLEITVADEVWNSGTELVHNVTQVVRNTREKTTMTTRTATVVNFPERTYRMDSISTMGDKQALVGKVHVDAKIAEDYYKGQSKASMRYETGSGDISTGTVNLTTNQVKATFTSDLAAELVPARSKPLKYFSKVKYDSDNSDPKLYAFQNRLTVENEFKGKYFGFTDMLVKKELRVHQEAGKSIFHAHAMSNVTKDGKLQRNSGLKLVVTSAVENSTFVAHGYTADERFQHNMTAKVVHSNQDPYTSLVKSKFHVTRFNLVGKREIQKILEGTVNKTTMFKNLMDWNVCEKGQIKILAESDIDWKQQVKLHDKEFRLHHEVKEIGTGRKGVNNTFLLDISAKVFYEQDQMKLGFREAHASRHHHPSTPKSVNFTISI